jgi:signal transduction histidine kinase
MLEEIVRMLNIALERKELREGLKMKEEEGKEYARKMQTLETEIKHRTTEISEQSEKLNTMNSYLDRINRDWEDSRNRLETMFKAYPDKVAMIDLQRNVIMTNREDVAIGDKCFRTFFDSDVPCTDCRLARVIREKTPIRIEIKHEDEFFEVHALPIFSAEHEVEGIIEFYRNITLEKTYEQQLQQADKLASLGQLVSGIGHEINNPNQFIRGNIKIIRQALDDMLPIVDDYQKLHPDLRIARLPYSFFREHIMVLVNDMEQGSVRIKNIVDGLKNFARKDEGQLIDTVDVNTVIDAMARLVHNQVHKTSDIELKLQRDLPVFTGNAQKIEQVLINLVINAAEAMPEDRRGLITVTTRKEDGHIIIEVKDNGKGMSDRTLKHIFDPFFTTKRAKGGTGLGLAIAYKIVQEHNGTITVNSRPDVGTTFTLRIPCRKTSQSERMEKVTL